MATPQFRSNGCVLSLLILVNYFLNEICKFISAFERHVLTLLQELKDSVAELKKGMAIMATQQSKACLETSPEEMPDGVSLPLDNTEEVAVLESKLTEDTNLRQLVVSRYD